MDFLEIHGLMAALSSRRPVFHSEADFQHELSWQIHAMHDDWPIRLEFPPFPDLEKRMAIDIWLPTAKIAIELKYCTRKFDRSALGERFSLGQAPLDVMRYDFLKDIQRLERVVTDYEPADHGLTVLITNNPLLWKQPTRSGVVDADFHVYDGRRIGGGDAMCWSDHASDGTKRSREESITLSHSYLLNWRDYSTLGDERGELFRYLAVTVPPDKEQ